jgi:hypothetical protein
MGSWRSRPSAGVRHQPSDRWELNTPGTHPAQDWPGRYVPGSGAPVVIASLFQALISMMR